MNHATPNRSFYTAVAVMLLLCFVPAGLTSWIGGRVGELTIPLSAPLEKLSMVVRAVPNRLDPEDPELVRLRTENEQQRVRITQLEARAADMARHLARLQSLEAIDPSFRYVTASRVAESLGKSDLYKVNVGSQIGVRAGALALYEGYQLLGRVSEVTPRSATITPITSQAFGSVTALVLPENGSVDGAIECSLDPLGDGSFRGDLPAESPIVPGRRVVWRDPSWIQLTTGPLIGFIESVTPNDDNLLFSVIVVRPQVNLADVSVVDLKIPRAGGDGGDN